MEKPLAILGFGGEGRAVLEFLRANKNFKNREIWILDRAERLDLPRGVRSRLGPDYLKNLSDFEIIFRSPGIPFTLPEINRARKAGVKFSSATKLFFEYCKVPIIGVTGTKGKGTTSTLIYKVLRAAKKKVFLAGNIGLPAIEILPKLTKDSLVILELSSFQLQDMDRSPKVAVVLEMFPDHQENIKTAQHGTHRSLKEYYAAKGNISRHQTEADTVFFFANQKISRVTGSLGRAKKIAVDPEKFTEFDPAELKIRGGHNFRNACMATLVAESLGVPKKIIVRIVRNFKGLEHRSELTRKIGNVTFYNDSASTNPQTSSAAIRAFKGESFSVILGGSDKGLDYAPVAKAIKESKPRLVVLMGANAKKIYKSINKSGSPIKFAKDLKSAVNLAYSVLTKSSKLKAVSSSVVFSPGAASFDMFKNYADRGSQFKKIVKGL